MLEEKCSTKSMMNTESQLSNSLWVKVLFLLVDDREAVAIIPARDTLDRGHLKKLLAARKIQLLEAIESEKRYKKFKQNGVQYLEDYYHFHIYCTDHIVEYDTLCFIQSLDKDAFLCSTDDFIRTLKPIVGMFSQPQ